MYYVSDENVIVVTIGHALFNLFVTLLMLFPPEFPEEVQELLSIFVK